MFYVYVLWSTDQHKFYIGYTKNLKRRLSEHHNGKVHTTARFKNTTLLFYEAFYHRADAERREVYFKTTKGKKALRIMLRESLKTLE